MRINKYTSKEARLVFRSPESPRGAENPKASGSTDAAKETAESLGLGRASTESLFNTAVVERVNVFHNNETGITLASIKKRNGDREYMVFEGTDSLRPATDSEWQHFATGEHQEDYNTVGQIDSYGKYLSFNKEKSSTAKAIEKKLSKIKAYAEAPKTYTAKTASLKRDSLSDVRSFSERPSPTKRTRTAYAPVEAGTYDEEGETSEDTHPAAATTPPESTPRYESSPTKAEKSAEKTPLPEGYATVDPALEGWIQDDSEWNANWPRINGTARVEEILSRDTFGIKNSNQVRDLLNDLLEKGTYREKGKTITHYRVSAKTIENFERFKLKDRETATKSQDIKDLMDAISNLSIIEIPDSAVESGREVDPQIQEAVQAVLGDSADPKAKYSFMEKLTGEGDPGTLDMYDVGSERKTEFTNDFLRQTMSEKAATQELMEYIYDPTKDPELNTEQKLRRALDKRAEVGVATVSYSKHERAQEIRQNLEARYGDLANPENADKAIKDIQSRLSETEISNLGSALDADTRDILRIGHVQQRLHISHSKENEKILSSNPEIRELQEALKRENPDLTEKDLQFIEKQILAGFFGSFDREGHFRLDAFKPIALPNGWTVTPSTAGVGVSKSFELSKDGRTVLTVGAQGWTTHGGVHAGFKFPVGEKLDMQIGGTVGQIFHVVPYYAGGVSLHRVLDNKYNEKVAERLDEEYFSEAARLIKENPNPSPEQEAQIADAIKRIPNYGAEIAQFQNRFAVADSGIIEIFKADMQNIENEVRSDGKAGQLRFKPRLLSGGVFAGGVGTIPFVGGWLEIGIFDKNVTVRTTLHGNDKEMANLNQAQFRQKLEAGDTEKLHLEPRMLANPHLVGRDVNGERFITNRFEEKEKTGSDFDSFTSFSEKLAQDADISLTPHSESGTSIISVGKINGNVEYHIDPSIEDMASVQGDNVLLAMADRNIIVTREDIFYPFQKDGEYHRTIVTIKRDPAVSRLDIMERSPSYILHLQGKQPVIKDGLNPGASGNILSYDEYLEASADLEGYTPVDRSGYESFSARMKAALNYKPNVFEQELQGDLEKFAQSVYEKMEGGGRNLYKRLSTMPSGKPMSAAEYEANLREVVSFIRSEASSQGVDLNAREMTEVMNYLAKQSFVHASDREKAFKNTLPFALEKVFKPRIEREIGSLRSRGVDVSSDAQAITDFLAEQLADTNFSVSPERLNEAYEIHSAVGTEGQVGLREFLGTNHNVYNFKKLNFASENPVERDAARVLLEITSPLPESDREFLQSDLALKVGGQDEAMYYIFGKEDSAKLAEIFESKSASPENSAVFNRFKLLVEAIRKAQIEGKDTISTKDIDGLLAKTDVIAKIATEVGTAADEICTNGDIISSELISFYEIGNPVAAKTENKVSTTPEVGKKLGSVILGVKAELGAKEKPPEKKKEDKKDMDEYENSEADEGEADPEMITDTNEDGSTVGFATGSDGTGQTGVNPETSSDIEGGL